MAQLKISVCHALQQKLVEKTSDANFEKAETLEKLSFYLFEGLIFTRVFCTFCQSTTHGDVYRIPDKSPKSSADKMYRTCE